MKTQIREVRVIDLITYAILSPILLALLIIFGFRRLDFTSFREIKMTIYCVLAIIAFYILLRRTAIGAVLWYKVLAPISVRERCRFTPTCSTYMILAINKYGIIVGIIKGIKRLLRCKPPNGGEDYP